MPQLQKVLVVFDDPATLRELLGAAAKASLQLLPIRERGAAMASVTQHADAAAVIVEQGRLSQNSLELLQNVQMILPKLRRIIVSDAADLSSVLGGLHSGAIDALLYRPVDQRQLHEAVTGICKPNPKSPPRSGPRAIEPAGSRRD